MRLEDKRFELSRVGREHVLWRACVELGYCSLGDTYDRLLDDPPATIAEFINAIIVGEGLNPVTTPNALRRSLRDIVLETVETHDGSTW